MVLNLIHSPGSCCLLVTLGSFLSVLTRKWLGCLILIPPLFEFDLLLCKLFWFPWIECYDLRSYNLRVLGRFCFYSGASPLNLSGDSSLPLMFSFLGLISLVRYFLVFTGSPFHSILSSFSLSLFLFSLQFVLSMRI